MGWGGLNGSPLPPIWPWWLCDQQTDDPLLVTRPAGHGTKKLRTLEYKISSFHITVVPSAYHAEQNAKTEFVRQHYKNRKKTNWYKFPSVIYLTHLIVLVRLISQNLQFLNSHARTRMTRVLYCNWWSLCLAFCYNLEKDKQDRYKCMYWGNHREKIKRHYVNWMKFFLSQTRLWQEAYFNFRDKNKNIFFQSCVSRREREIENYFLRSSEKKWRWFTWEFPGMRISATLCLTVRMI